MEVTKKNGKVCFSEDTHTYWNEDTKEKYISVTTLVHKYTQPFDKEFWSKYKALEKLIPSESWSLEKRYILEKKRFKKDLLSKYNISDSDLSAVVSEILEEWDRSNKESCERGTKIHLDMENAFYDSGSNTTLDQFNIKGCYVCKKDYMVLDLENGVYPEYLISKTTNDGVLRIAGQIDVLIKQGNEFSIADFKTNKKIDLKSGYDMSTRSSTKMLYPLNHLDDCNFNHYQLQLSTYAWMIEQLNPDYKIKDLVIKHISHDNEVTLYNCKYLKTEVERMLKHYKLQLLKEQRLSKHKKIEYGRDYWSNN